MPSITAYVRPELLVWARMSANLEVLAAARKINEPLDRIQAWEAGTSRPTIAQLRKAAAIYKRPLAAFYLAQPPQGFETLRDFRLPDPTQSGEWSVALHAEYRRAHFQRDALLDIAELEQQDPPRSWLLARVPRSDADVAPAARANLTSIVSGPQPTASFTEYDHIGYWTRALEDSGVLVMSTQGGLVSQGEMRAFSLYFDVVPVIMLNGSDSPRGRVFSLLHEYVHLLLHTEGLCDVSTDQRAFSENRQFEARCNAIAAEILMPSANVMGLPAVSGHNPDEPWHLRELVEAARPFGVSAEAFLRRLTTLGKVSHEEYRQFRAAHAQGGPVKAKRSGGSFYYNKARDLGKGYVRTVTRAHNRALIDSATAAEYLDAKVGQISRLAKVSEA